MYRLHLHFIDKVRYSGKIATAKVDSKMFAAEFDALMSAPLAPCVPAGSVPAHEIQNVDALAHLSATTGAFQADYDLKNNEGNVEMEKAALVHYRKIANLGIAGNVDYRFLQGRALANTIKVFILIL